MKDGQTVAGIALTVVVLAASLLANPGRTDRTTTVALPVLMMLFLTSWFWLVPRISPTVASFGSTYRHLGLASLGLLAYVHILLLWSVRHPAVGVARALAGGVCVFMMLEGNVLGRVRRNGWIGLRTPWTLADERVWNATHRMAGYLTVAAGALGLIASMAGWLLAVVWLLVAVVMASLLCSLIYARRLRT